MDMPGKKLLCSVVMLGLICWGASGIGSAQEAGASSKSGAQSEPAADARSKSLERPLEVYHVEFSIIELEEGKKINARQYSTNVSTHEPSDIKIGTRVPVEAKEGEFQYLDVGTSVSARIQEDRGQKALIVHAEISNFAIPEQNEKPGYHPLVRQLRIGGTTLLPLEKPIIIGSADDPNSKRHFQLEVAVTQLK
jgi:hypothetical protein